MIKKYTGSMPDSERLGRQYDRDRHVSRGRLGRPQRDAYKVPRGKVGPGSAFLFMLSFEEKATDGQG